MEMFNKLPYEMCGLHMMSGGFDSAGIYIQVSVAEPCGSYCTAETYERG